MGQIALSCAAWVQVHVRPGGRPHALGGWRALLAILGRQAAAGDRLSACRGVEVVCQSLQRVDLLALLLLQCGEERERAVHSWTGVHCRPPLCNCVVNLHCLDLAMQVKGSEGVHALAARTVQERAQASQQRPARLAADKSTQLRSEALGSSFVLLLRRVAVLQQLSVYGGRPRAAAGDAAMEQAHCGQCVIAVRLQAAQRAVEGGLTSRVLSLLLYSC